MFRSRASRRYSLYHHRSRGRRRLRLLRFVILLFLVYQIINSLLLTSYRIDSSSMSPTLAVSERVLASPVGYGARIPLLPWTTPVLREPQRGDIVVIASPSHQPPATLLRLTDPLVRFFTLNRVSPVAMSGAGWDNPYIVKRIVGLPGDTLQMRGSVARVTPAGSAQSTSEHALSTVRYNLDLLDVPAAAGALFFTHSEPLTLGQGEYFVLGDNRTASIDSRHFGPVTRDRLRQRVVLRFWPLQRLGVTGN